MTLAAILDIYLHAQEFEEVVTNTGAVTDAVTDAGEVANGEVEAEFNAKFLEFWAFFTASDPPTPPPTAPAITSTAIIAISKNVILRKPHIVLGF